MGSLIFIMCNPLPELVPLNNLSLTRDDLFIPVRNLFLILMKDVVENKRVKLANLHEYIAIFK